MAQDRNETMTLQKPTSKIPDATDAPSERASSPGPGSDSVASDAGPEERLVIVANRLPVRRCGGRADDGREGEWETSPGGLVSALSPLLSRTGGSWVGWDGTSSGSAPAPFDHEGMRIRPVPITGEDVEGFYRGFSNTTLWPLYHDSIREPVFRRKWWWPYQRVNMHFAEASSEQLPERGGLLWVQDYQLQLVPAMVRELRPDARIGFFLHIPFPPEELFGKIPWRSQILEGLLGADVLGFQTKLSAQNFSRAARKFTEATGTDARLRYRGRQIEVNAFPISIDVDRFRSIARDPAVIEHAKQSREEWGERRIILGVDRLDYTKGVDIRLRAYEEVLNRGSVSADNTVFIQVAVPTREQVEEYEQLRETVEHYVGRINGQHASSHRVAVQYLYRSLPQRELVALYKAADVMLVTPLRDGMNLVAKEYVATRTENTGVLVLSEFAGAALELRQALLVNPYDIDGTASRIEEALSLTPPEAARRMRSLRAAVQRHSVHDWSASFLRRLGDVRR